MDPGRSLSSRPAPDFGAVSSADRTLKMYTKPPSATAAADLLTSFSLELVPPPCTLGQCTRSIFINSTPPPPLSAPSLHFLSRFGAMNHFGASERVRPSVCMSVCPGQPHFNYFPTNWRKRLLRQLEQASRERGSEGTQALFSLTH
jgi:hypothetical protein